MLEGIAEILLEVTCGVTGHGILWLVTLGRWRVFQKSDNLATLVGMLFWGLIGVGIALVLLWRKGFA